MEAQAPPAAIAARLLAAFGDRDDLDHLHIAPGESLADEIARALSAFAPDFEILVLPPWDCLPYDRVSPSREAMGRRIDVLTRLTSPPAGPRITVASVQAALQRVPPPRIFADEVFRLSVGETLDREALVGFAARTGYIIDDRVDEAGEIAVLNDVIDVFPADGARPLRLVLDEDGVIEDLRPYNAASQRTEESVTELTLRAASELILEKDASSERVSSGKSMEEQLLARYGSLGSLFGHLGTMSMSFAAGLDGRLTSQLEMIEEAWQTRRDLGEDARKDKQDFYLRREDWDEALRDAIEVDLSGIAPSPDFFLQVASGTAFAAFVEAQAASGKRVLISGIGPELKKAERSLVRAGVTAKPVGSLREVLDAPEGSILVAPFDLAEGFVDADHRLAVVAAPDLFGARLFQGETPDLDALVAEPELRVGDVVIHEDHGLGILRSLETVEVDGVVRDTVRLEYDKVASLLVPVEDFGRIWRYGGDADAVKLDRLNTTDWTEKRASISREIDEAARELLAAAKEREERPALKIVPPKAAYAKFAKGFPYPETADQSAAIGAVMGDLASGRRMNRLICGDVGFGKTEVALRGAAATALSGKQAVLVVPTTVLARQHFETFRRRFAGSGIEVGHLSRVVAAAGAKAVKEGLRTGTLKLVVATQAVAAKDVSFADLGLLIIDEEHRFGARLKQSLRDMAPDLHVLTMSATPIPRTLQSAMVGVQDVSVLANPPARRRPVRTFFAPYDAATVKTALLRESRRGGQNFVVVPRIEDIEKVASELGRLVPELSLRIAHGGLDGRDMDEAMVAFADGKGDILLATNIIESGLDVPRANTMIVWGADRFGLAQLHQLRGRVGRARAQGVCYLLTDPDAKISDDTRSRLSTLVAFDRLGSGLAISARDLDIRGAGDLVGEEQAGHMKLIGISLYQRLLARAVDLARGGGESNTAEPEIRLDMAGSIPEAYVPEATVRLNLYARLLRIAIKAEIDAFGDELEDRFGALPLEVRVLLAIQKLKLATAHYGVAKVDAGPKAIALSFVKSPTEARWKKLCALDEVERRDHRLIYRIETEAGEARLAAVQGLLDRIG